MPRAAVLFGPTAVGKTALLHQVLDDRYEIINADSMQVYRYLDIGTAKPSRDERGGIPYHLIDIVEPDDQFTAGAFTRRAEELIRRICADGRRPIVAGGAGFYLRSLLCGLSDVPPSDPVVRERLDNELVDQGSEALHRELTLVDAESAARIHPRNRQRIVRALEVFRVAGRPLSTFRPPDRIRDDFRFHPIGLLRDRAELLPRITARVCGMFEHGLPDELEAVLGRGYTPEDPGLCGIGYRQFFACGAVDQGVVNRDPDVLERVATEIAKETRRFAKRQRTFFRKIDAVEWLSVEAADTLRSRLAAFFA